MTKWIVYVLKNPRTNEVRYVGYTSASPEVRLRQHVNEAAKGTPRTHRQRWVLSLVSIGLVPLIEVLESGSGEGWQEAERRWIAFHRAQGARLVNGTDGGDMPPVPPTREGRHARALKREARKTPEERRRQMANALAARTPEDRRAVIAKTNASRTPEHRREAALKRADLRECADRLNATYTTQKHRAARLKQIQNTTHQQRSEAIRKAKATLGAEGRRAAAQKRIENMTPEARSAAAYKGWETRRKQQGSKSA